MRLRVSPTTTTPTGVFRGLRLRFPHTGTLGCAVCVAPHLFLPVYLHANVGLLGLPAATLPGVLPTQLPVSAPPTSLGECCFFNSLVVSLPYSLIFCHFWLFFVLKFVAVLLLVVWGGTVYLPMPPSWLEVPYTLSYTKSKMRYSFFYWIRTKQKICNINHQRL